MINRRWFRRVFSWNMITRRYVLDAVPSLSCRIESVAITDGELSPLADPTVSTLSILLDAYILLYSIDVRVDRLGALSSYIQLNPHEWTFNLSKIQLHLMIAGRSEGEGKEFIERLACEGGRSLSAPRMTSVDDDTVRFSYTVHRTTTFRSPRFIW